MKFTLSWLKDHLQTSAPADEIAATLTRIGLEVEEVIDPAKSLGAFRVARVLEAEPHPNADKLRVCKVDTGREVVQVVCGAPNARAGLIGVFAAPGTTIPGSGITLGNAKIRGVESAGMLCSERELELSNEHTGIIELPEDAGKRIGERFIDVAGLNDAVFDIAITPNRPDCLGVRGVARDLAAAGLGKLRKADEGYTARGDFACPVAIELDFPKAAANACPVFAGRVIRGVRNGPSPEWMQRRLRAIGLRPINLLVDVTNYISYDRARPLHVYDADKLTGPVSVRLGKAGERFLALDGRTYEVDESICVIADGNGVLGLGGVMGGEVSGATDATTNVFIESAWFDPARTAGTGRRTGINSDARYRFERGVDPQSVLPGLALATKLILQHGGGEPSEVRIAGKVPEDKAFIAFDQARVQKLTSARYTANEVVTALKKLGFTVEGQAPKLTVGVPSWRPDVHGAADLVEEVVRLSGAERVPSTPLPAGESVGKPVLSLLQKRVITARRTLAGRGMVEAITWSFITGPLAKRFGGGAPALKLANPISSEMSDMRPSLLPGLLSAAQANANRGFLDVALFEAGQVYQGDAPEDQRMAAAGIRTGAARLTGGGRLWDGESREVDVFAAKADAFALLAALGFDPQKAQISRAAPDWYHPGRSGAIQLGPKLVIGFFGELHPETARRFDLDGRVAVFEITLDAVPAARRKGTARGPLVMSDFQAVKRDFAFLVDRDVEAGAVTQAAQSAEKALITDVAVFDVFAGQGVPQGKKSLGIEVTIQAQDHTLTEAEIDAVSKKIVAEVQKSCGAELRA